MSEVERKILRQFAVELKRDVIPSEVLPHLLCLTEDDCEQIQREEDRKGARAAVATLLDRLKKRLRQGAFKELTTALGEVGCPHLQISLENALSIKDEERQPKPEHNNPTQDTSKSQSSSLKTPTTETAKSLNPSTPENKQLKKPTKSNKKLKKGPVPKENTTSPPESKTHAKVKTAHSSDSQPTDTTDANPPYVKLVKTPKNTQSKKSGASHKVPECPPETKNNEDSKKKISSNNNLDTQPPPPTDPEEADLTGNSTTQYDTLVCYAKENRQIALELKQFLETECGLQVCIDFENFMPGKPIADNITESINSSRSVIFLLSPKFLKKLWARYELKHAVYNLNESINNGKNKKIIPVLLEKCEVPHELKIYTAIEMEGYGSRKDCWKKLAAAISGTSYSDDNGSGNGCNDDEDDGGHNGEDNGNGKENDSEENDGETSNDGANNEVTIGVSDNHNSDDDDSDEDGDDDDSDEDGDDDDSDEDGDDDDEDVNDNDLDQDGKDTVHGSNKAESNDDDSSSDNGDDAIDGDKDGSENSSHDSDNNDNYSCDGDDVTVNNSNDAGVVADSSHNNCEVDDGNNAKVDTNSVVVHSKVSGDNAGVNNANNMGKDGYGTGKIDSL